LKNPRPLLSPFVLALSAIVAVLYAYLAWRLTTGLLGRLALIVPLAAIWAVPVIYWICEREPVTAMDEALHVLSYLSMGWLNFAVLLSLLRDGALLAAAGFHLPALRQALSSWGADAVLAGSMLALGGGMLAALRGPKLRHIDVPVAGLPPDLHGLKIALISDLHVGPTVGRAYVRRVVHMSNALNADLVALTGDLVDGPVARLRSAIAPLAQLAPAGRVFAVLGNHDYYAGAQAWIEHFRSLGLCVLLNEAEIVARGNATLVVGGVLDPAASLFDREQGPRPELAAVPGAGAAFRLLLAHNPKLAPQAEQVGFDLQLSGHTHAGQFFPWTLAVRWVHAPHVAGLSRQGRMWVYVSSGTGTWGPPVRFGTEPELTLLRVVRPDLIQLP